MSSFVKPKIDLKNSPKNALGLKRQDYDGVMSTLCAGCGHDSVTAAMATAFYELCLLYTSPSPRDATLSRMPSSA